MDTLTAFGLFAVTTMLVTYALEEQHRGFILAFAGSCALGSVYGFLQGAWPFGRRSHLGVGCGAPLVAKRILTTELGLTFKNLADRVETRLFGGDDMLTLKIPLGLSK